MANLNGLILLNIFFTLLDILIHSNHGVAASSGLPTANQSTGTGVTCGERTGSASYKLRDGVEASCAYGCPAGRRKYNASLEYIDMLSGIDQLESMERPVPGSPGKGYDYQHHAFGLKSIGSHLLTVRNMTVTGWIYVNSSDTKVETDQIVLGMYFPTLEITMQCRGNRETSSIEIHVRHFIGINIFHHSTWKIENRVWVHLAVQLAVDGVHLFVNGKHIWPASQISEEVMKELALSADTPDIYIGNSRNGYRRNTTTSLFRGMVQDLRIYTLALTNSEIDAIARGSTALPGPLPECLCPHSHPKRVEPVDTSQTCEDYMDQAYNASQARRFENNVYPVQNAFDGNPDTFWLSQPGVTPITIVVQLVRTFEVHSLEVDFQPQTLYPEKMVIGGGPNKHQYEVASTCSASTARCQKFPDSPGGVVTVNFNASGPYVSAEIKITISGFSSHEDLLRYYAVKEITVFGRCFCNGRSSSCNASSPLTCVDCLESHGDSCEFCDENHGDSTECQCTHCYTKKCNQTNGQCECPANVIGSACMDCEDGYFAKDLSALQKEGCTEQCNCDVKGTKPQSPCKGIGGQCPCKQFATSRRCSECIDGYWNLGGDDAVGCEQCGCYEGGTIDGTFCNKATRQCHCRPLENGYKINSLLCEPFVIAIVPEYGPRAGGTSLAIIGGYFNYQKTANVSIGGLPCRVVNITDSVIYCLTQELNASAAVGTDTPLVVDVALADGQTPPVNSKFQYRPDPILESVEPLETIPAGGVLLTVKGEHFKSVYRPYMNITLYHKEKIEDTKITLCNVSSDAVIFCETPFLKIPLGLRDVVKRETPIRVKRQSPPENAEIITPYENELKVYIGFIFDGVPTYRDLSESLPKYKELVIFPNPKFIRFNEILEFHQYSSSSSDYEVDIKGDGFRLGYRQYTIKVGTKICKLLKKRVNLLTCSPPQMEMTGQYELYVEVGVKSEHHHVGHLKYYVNMTDNPAILGAIVACCVILPVVIVVCVVVFLFVRRRRRLIQEKLDAQSIDLQPVDVTSNAYEDNPCYIPPCYTSTLIDMEFKAVLQSFLIDRCNLVLHKVIGKGHFGQVQDGYFRVSTSKEEIHVAIKSLRGSGLSGDDVTAFLKEATIMRDFDHPNVLGLVGVVLDEGEPLVVLPFMDHGDLKKYVSNDDRDLRLGELLVMARQVADGMAYLSDKRFVHRDLAARNCMLNRDMVVKIADFGLSRDIYETDYYTPVKGKNQAMPIRWMAVESMVDGRYTSKSDVWSFGVVLWELVTRGALPYPDLGNHEVKDYVRNGYRMVAPSNATTEVYQIMQDCWKTEADSRPSFHEVSRRLTVMTSSYENEEVDSEYIDLEDGYIEPVP